MPSTSPSPGKRPSLHDRKSSTLSLSSSGKPAGAGAGAARTPRPRLVSRHSRNASHGKNLNNMPKKALSTVYGEGRNHKRTKSGATTPVASPKSTDGNIKRNNSHVVLPKNRSHSNLRKNKSTTTLTGLNRNLSRGALNKLGAAPNQKAKKEEQQKQGVFDLGGNSEEEDEEDGEWEDSTVSPELTRNNSKNNSKISTPARAQSPNGETIQKPPDVRPLVPEKTSSPPEPTALKPNRSAPNLQHSNLAERPKADPAVLQQNGRGSRAPPAMSTATARSTVGHAGRVDSQRALNDAKSHRSSIESPGGAKMTPQTPATPATATVGQSSSGSASVSHFLTNDPSLARSNTTTTGALSSDDESISDFMNTYKPQPSESPDKRRPTSHINKARLSSAPSRTQQKLELQRREVMRGAPGPSMSGGMALSVGSSASVHSRSASKGRNAARGSMTGEYNVDKLVKQDYESAIKQLTVVRRFKNPILESLGRLREIRTPPSKEDGHNASRRPQSRHGKAASAGGNPKNATASMGDDGQSNVSTRAGGNGGPRASTGRVQFQLSRDASADDMGVLTTSQGSPEVSAHRGENDGLSAEEALIRRMWEARVHERVA